MPPKHGKRRNRGKRLNQKKSEEPKPNINPYPISEYDKSYIFVVKNKTDNYRVDNPTATIAFELPLKHYYNMETNITIETSPNPTKLYLYNKESNIITGPFIGVTPVYKDNRRGIKFPSRINVKPITNCLRVNINNYIIKEGVCSLQYINCIINCSLPKLPQLDVGIQVNEKDIKKDTEHISEAVFDSLDI
tara:strand:+ start:323 stop:895 length:573 start_codon:yes stop_codon:yes gene_type:complete